MEKKLLQLREATECLPQRLKSFFFFMHELFIALFFPFLVNHYKLAITNYNEPEKVLAAAIILPT